MHNHQQTKQSIAILALIVNVVLVVLKLSANLHVHSTTLLVESIHTLLDVLSSVIALIGVFFVRSKSLEKHIALFEILLICGSVGFVGFRALQQLHIHPNNLINVHLGITVLIISLLFNAGMCLALFKQAILTQSTILFGNANHFLIDILVDVVALVGFICMMFWPPPIVDSITTLLLLLPAGLIVSRATTSIIKA